MKKLFLISILLLFSLILSACTQEAVPTEVPTQEVYMPTRSVATLPAPTKAPSCTNSMTFIGDANYQDGAYVAPGETILKEWEIYNSGDCAWGDGYRLFFISGEQLGAPDILIIPHVEVASRTIISVELTAPDEPGTYHSEWKLFGADNRFFGESLYVDVIVQ